MSNPDLNLLAKPFFNNRIHNSRSQLENSFMYYTSCLCNTLSLPRAVPSTDRFKKTLFKSVSTGQHNFMFIYLLLPDLLLMTELQIIGYFFLASDFDVAP